MMASGPPPINFSSSPPQNDVRIPFEYSKIMDDSRVEVLKKFRNDIINQVKFSDISSTLIACGLVSKDECFEICKLSVKRQMEQCFQKIHDIMDILVCQQEVAIKNRERENYNNRANCDNNEASNKQNGLVKNIWDNFLLSLKKEHVPLATKIENELYKCAESKLLIKGTNTPKSGGNGSVKGKTKSPTKADIGLPMDFQHVRHYGLRPNKNAENVEKAGEPAESLLMKIKEELEKNDPDLQAFFKRARVEERHLNNTLTKQIIVKFIAEHGGMETIRKEVREQYPELLQKTVESISKDISLQSDKSDSLNEGKDKMEKNSQGQSPQAPPPANVPFQPTPKPTSVLYYF